MAVTGIATNPAQVIVQSPDGLWNVVTTYYDTDDGGVWGPVVTREPLPGNPQYAIDQAIASLSSLVASMDAQVAQGQTDLTTLAASQDALAPIISRMLQGELALTQGVADVLTALQLVAVP